MDQCSYRGGRIQFHNAYANSMSMQVPFQVPLEVNVVLIGFNGDGGYRYSLDAHKLEEFLRVSFPSHRPSCFETGELLDIEHHIVFNAFPVSLTESTKYYICSMPNFLV